MSQSISETDHLSSTTIVTPENITTSEKGSEFSTISWWEASKQVLPIYLATHIAFLALTYLATLFSLNNFSTNALHLRTLLDSWNHWDTGWYTYIATNGYSPDLGATWDFSLSSHFWSEHSL
jgi:hypothetical protein